MAFFINVNNNIVQINNYKYFNFPKQDFFYIVLKTY